ncbi:hypothetical protein DRQ33_05275, partial [bacterium]
MRLKIIYIGILIAIISTLPAEFDIGGYYKNFFMLYDMPEYMSFQNQFSGTMTNTFRFEFTYSPEDFTSFNLAYNISASVIEPSLAGEGLGFGTPTQNKYRFNDIAPKIYSLDKDSAGILQVAQNLDRAYFRVSAKFLDAYIGRQVVAWGSGRMVNPSNVISPFSYDELDKEEYIGVDAVRVRIPVGALSEIDMGYIAGERFRMNNNAFFINTRLYLLQTDVT